MRSDATIRMRSPRSYISRTLPEARRGRAASVVTRRRLATPPAVPGRTAQSFSVLHTARPPDRGGAMSRRTSTIVIAGVVVLVGSPFAFSATRDNRSARGCATRHRERRARDADHRRTGHGHVRHAPVEPRRRRRRDLRLPLRARSAGDRRPEAQHAVHPREQPRQRQGVRLPGQAQPDRRHDPDRPEPHGAEARLGAVRHERDRRRGRPERRSRRQPQRQRDHHAGRERGRQGDPGRGRRSAARAPRTRRSPAAAASRPRRARRCRTPTRPRRAPRRAAGSSRPTSCSARAASTASTSAAAR